MSPETAQRARTAVDQEWFAARVDALLPELYGVAVRLCRDRTNAEDLVAESIARAWERLPSLEDRAAFRAWIFRILHNSFVSPCGPGAPRSSS